MRKTTKLKILIASVVSALMIISSAYVAFSSETPFISAYDNESNAERNIGEPSSEPTEEEEYPTGIWREIWDFLIHIIIPREGYFQNEYEKMNALLRKKLPYQVYIDTIERLNTVEDYFAEPEIGLPEHWEDENNGIVIFLGVITHYGEPIAVYFRPVIYGFYIFLLAVFNYRQIMFLLRGVNYSGIQFPEEKEPIGFRPY